MTRDRRTVRAVSADPAPGPAEEADQPADGTRPPDVAALIPMLRRVVGARAPDPTTAEDLVQETLVRVLGALDRIDPEMLEPYAIVTARNVIASMWEEKDRHQRNQHRVVDLRPPASPDEDLLAAEEKAAVAQALARLGEHERATLIAHEVGQQDTRTLASELGLSPGAVAAQLNRTRARLRVEYLLAMENADVPTSRCRPVLLAISGGDRRRQREVDAARHLLECDLCARLSSPLMERGHQRDEEVRIPVKVDADIVAARQTVRELASRAGFRTTDLTLIATAVSEVARNIVRFAGQGEITVELVESPRRGVQVVARDTGPGIVDVDRALADGYSTYAGLGLGLPGARRLMDEFAVASEVGRGTTVTMTKWLQER
jgi:RNA polymerase sigma factor (sigma-70 family)